MNVKLRHGSDSTYFITVQNIKKFHTRKHTNLLLQLIGDV